MFTAIASLTMGWPWLSAFVLSIALYVLPQQSVLRAAVIPFYTSAAIPLAVLAMLIPHVLSELRQLPVSSNPKLRHGVV
jgi:hypothetical protein